MFDNSVCCNKLETNVDFLKTIKVTVCVLYTMLKPILVDIKSHQYIPIS